MPLMHAAAPIQDRSETAFGRSFVSHIQFNSTVAGTIPGLASVLPGLDLKGRPAFAINQAYPLTRPTRAPIPEASVGRTAAPASAERRRERKVRAPSTYGAG